ncbi:MAG: hypothetical protein ACP5NI_05250 [Acetobacteraceae bacterium]
MRRLLQAQLTRIEESLHRGADPRQLVLDFSVEERRQQEDDRRAWRRRLDRLPDELDAEPQRIEAGYQVRAARLDPVGIVYLWPVTG